MMNLEEVVVYMLVPGIWTKAVSPLGAEEGQQRPHWKPEAPNLNLSSTMHILILMMIIRDVKI